MPPLSSVLRNCFYPVFELTLLWGGGGGVGRVCVPILCVIQVVKLKKKYKDNHSILLKEDTYSSQPVRSKAKHIAT
jgi:hypothetical protein